jgi:hypothetical protein
VAQELPSDVAQFIVEYVDSVEQLEVLLLVRATAPKDWDGPAVARELRIDSRSAGNRLAGMAARGLLVTTDEAAGRYRFDPKSPELKRVVGRLADTYDERRVSVITLIFSKPNDTIRSFADAFRIRKDEKDRG